MKIIKILLLITTLVWCKVESNTVSSKFNIRKYNQQRENFCSGSYKKLCIKEVVDYGEKLLERMKYNLLNKHRKIQTRRKE